MGSSSPSESAIELVRGDPPFLPYTEVTLAEVLADAGSVPEAHAPSETAAAMLQQLGALQAGEGSCWSCTRGCSPRPASSSGGVEARRWFEHRASSNAEAEIRAADLAIPEHCAILETP